MPHMHGVSWPAVGHLVYFSCSEVDFGSRTLGSSHFLYLWHFLPFLLGMFEMHFQIFLVLRWEARLALALCLREAKFPPLAQVLVVVSGCTSQL